MPFIHGTDFSRKNNIIKKVEQLSIADTKVQVWGYFGLQGIINITQAIQDPLEALYLVNISTATI